MEDPTPRVDAPDAGAPPTTPHSQLSAAELVAKSIAPVKREFLRPPPVRNGDRNADEREAPQEGSATAVAAAPLLKEKKSKRQWKRDRLQVSELVGHSEMNCRFFFFQTVFDSVSLRNFRNKNPCCIYVRW